MRWISEASRDKIVTFLMSVPLAFPNSARTATVTVIDFSIFDQ